MTVNLLEPAKAALLVFAAAILQVTIFSEIDIIGGYPDVVLLTLVAIALLRGSIYGAACGFFAGLILDTATLSTLGLTSLLLTIAGYWIGRYGETTGRDRSHAPLLTVFVATIAIAYAGYGLHFLLGEELSARRALFETLLPTLVLNLAVARPVFALCRSALDRPSFGGRVSEVKLLG
jgi:rod shape-determining protein MreD